ncbi:MAG: hypothetical protein FH753_06375 [Firmicutes bacterium]|nr:hypothetical protein [Bacillota bacterium]
MKLVKYLFYGFERLVVKLGKWKYIPNSKDKMIYISPHKYKGDDFKLPDGTIIKSGDMVIELHVDNLKTEKIDNDYKTLFKVFKNELKALKKASKNNKSFSNIKAFHGTTVLYPICKRQGFTIYNLDEGINTFLLKIWDNILRIVFRKNKLKRKTLRMPKDCWISKENLSDI